MASQVSPENVADVNLLHGLSLEEIAQVLAVCDDVHCAENELLFRAGEPSLALYILMQGTVDVVLEAPRRQETSIASFEAKAVFGESSFFSGGAHHASLRCLTPVDAIRLKRVDFERLLSDGCRAALRIGTNAAVILAARLQVADDRIAAELQAEEDQQFRTALHRYQESMVQSFARAPGFVRGPH